MPLEELVVMVVSNAPTFAGLGAAVLLSREYLNRLFASFLTFEDRLRAIETQMSEMNAHLVHIAELITAENRQATK